MSENEAVEEHHLTNLDENEVTLIKTNETITSPSGKYRMDIVHTNRKGYFITSAASIYRNNDNFLIHTIANSSLPRHQFFYRKGEEWLRSGDHYMLQLFINLDTNEVYNDAGKIRDSEACKNGAASCWTGVDMTDDGFKLKCDDDGAMIF